MPPPPKPAASPAAYNPGMICRLLPNTRESQVGLKAAQRLAGENVEFHRDKRAMRRIEDPVRLGGPDQPVADI